MLGGFRTLNNSPILKVLLGLLALSFMFWGIGEYTSGGTSTALRVNGEPVSAQLLERIYNAQIQFAEQQMGQKIPADVLPQLGLGSRALSLAIRDKVYDQMARSLGIVASDQAILQEIQKNPAFHTDGKFDPARYTSVLRQVGYTTAAFENELRLESTRKTVEDLFWQNITDKNSLKNLAGQEYAKIDIQTLSLSPKDLPALPTPSDEELQKLYQQLASKYADPAKRTFETLTLSAAALAVKQTVSDEEINAYYETHKSEYLEPETRSLEHFMVATEASATAITAELASGTSFAELLKKYKPETKADLGHKHSDHDSHDADEAELLADVSRDELVDELAEPVFKAEKNTNIGPVKTELGYHFIRVVEITPAQTVPLADVREAVRSTIQSEKAFSRFLELQTDLTDRLAAGENFPAIAQATGLELQTFTDRTNMPGKDIDGDILAAAYNTTVGRSSLPVKLDEREQVYIFVKSETPAQSRPFEAVKADVLADYKAQQQAGALQELAQAIITERQMGKPFTAIKAERKLSGEIETLAGLTRSDSAKANWMGLPALRKLFSLQANGVYERPISKADKLVVAAVAARSVPEISDAEMTRFAQAYSGLITQDMRTLFLSTQANQATVQYTMPLLKQIFGDSFAVNQLPVPPSATLWNLWGLLG